MTMPDDRGLPYGDHPCVYAVLVVLVVLVGVSTFGAMHYNLIMGNRSALPMSEKY